MTDYSFYTQYEREQRCTARAGPETRSSICAECDKLTAADAPHPRVFCGMSTTTQLLVVLLCCRLALLQTVLLSATHAAVRCVARLSAFVLRTQVIVRVPANDSYYSLLRPLIYDILHTRIRIGLCRIIKVRIAIVLRKSCAFSLEFISFFAAPKTHSISIVSVHSIRVEIRS